MIIDDIAIVENFLSDFFQKKSIWQIRFENRDKNIRTLADLELTPNDRIKVIDSLQATDYCEGPNSDKMGFESDMWIFGKMFKNTELYIKITMGFEGQPVICISFHPSERPMSYPFKSS